MLYRDITGNCRGMFDDIGEDHALLGKPICIGCKFQKVCLVFRSVIRDSIERELSIKKD